MGASQEKQGGRIRQGRGEEEWGREGKGGDGSGRN